MFSGFSTNAIIKEYAVAHLAADDNPKLLIKNPVKYTLLCNARMFRIALIDEAILNIGEREDAPIELKNFLIAEADKGCPSCWISSKKNNNHADCQKKIDRWFETRQKLIELGKSLQPGWARGWPVASRASQKSSSLLPGVFGCTFAERRPRMHRG